MIDKDTSLNDLFDIAINTIADVNKGEEFIVRDLFRGFEWNRIPLGNRTKLGSMVLAYSNADGEGVIAAVRKTPQNQQIYTRL